MILALTQLLHSRTISSFSRHYDEELAYVGNVVGPNHGTPCGGRLLK